MLELCKDGKKTKGISPATWFPASELLGAMSTENHSAMIKDKGFVGLERQERRRATSDFFGKGNSDVCRNVWGLE